MVFPAGVFGGTLAVGFVGDTTPLAARAPVDRLTLFGLTLADQAIATVAATPATSHVLVLVIVVLLSSACRWTASWVNAAAHGSV